MTKKEQAAADKKFAAVNKAKEDLVVAQTNFDTAQSAFDNADEGADKDLAAEILETATKDLETAQSALDELSVGVLVKVRALLPLAGKFLLPYDPGTEFQINELQGAEIVEAKYGEYVK